MNEGSAFGSHCLHENRPHSYRSEELVFATYFNAGFEGLTTSWTRTTPSRIRALDTRVPPNQAAAQINDVFVAEDHTVFVTDRVNGGVYILEPEHHLVHPHDAISVVSNRGDPIRS